MIHLGDCLDPGTVSRIVTEPIDLLCTDAPYSPKTHAGHGAAVGKKIKNDIDYSAWGPTEVEAFCDLWIPLTRGWVVSITDNVLAPHWLSSFGVHGLMPFAPLPLVEVGGRHRACSDGPSNWTVWVCVARPRKPKFSRWGILPGAYITTRGNNGGNTRIVGGKPLSAMEAIVRDYSSAGDLVCDPCAGAGTTLVAAKRLGRRLLGMERDPERHALASRQVAETAHIPWLWPERTKERVEQEEMFG